PREPQCVGRRCGRAILLQTTPVIARPRRGAAWAAPHPSSSRSNGACHCEARASGPKQSRSAGRALSKSRHGRGHESTCRASTVSPTLLMLPSALPALAIASSPAPCSAGALDHGGAVPEQGAALLATTAGVSRNADRTSVAIGASSAAFGVSCAPRPAALDCDHSIVRFGLVFRHFVIVVARKPHFGLLL